MHKSVQLRKLMQVALNSIKLCMDVTGISLIAENKFCSLLNITEHCVVIMQTIKEGLVE